ncbi:tRNA lysidine(34) synthetase TilS [Stappia stellulata]|uniref:tRNA lysidine(34) synthetase TilS n=1 Tax=Stappia stellulata TaxID=71235 RepID=UPI0004113BB5|nr:tRNA lysidine(34) synthetase TilS [Stappia stellulata]
MAAPDCEPSRAIAPDEADRLFSVFGGYRKLAVAVSGGADSLALMVLLAEWRHRTSCAPELSVLTVDHGLRPEAGGETEMVAGLARAQGLECRILKWAGDKPSGNLQAEARDARFALMARALADDGGDALVLAHHLEDQAETFLLRLARGSGVYGLASMAPVAERDGVVLLRPLLGIAKARLAATLAVRDIAWCSDPSNDDLAFARVRVRALLPELAAEGLTPRRLGETAARMGRASAALDAWVRDVATRHAQVHAAGPVRLPLAALAAVPEEVLLRLVSRLLRRVGGQAYPVRIEKLERLVGDLAGKPGAQATLAGAVVRRTASALVMWREYGRSPPEPLVARGPGAWIWDGRFAVSTTTVEKVAVVARADMVKRGDAAPAIAMPAGWPAQAFDTAPCLLRDGDAPYCPGFGTAAPPASVHLSLLPLFEEAELPGNSLNSLHSRTT